ncbi:hypothetical protein SHAL103562_06035 [Shewanella algae]|uniref:Uncharacterized protein n=1 Tax=Shewanella algae TaxID=38313 RepID=A0A379Z0G2_9GAMM|nr:Uncharacterised protein [Shewanella algae]
MAPSSFVLCLPLPVVVPIATFLQKFIQVQN